MAAGRLLFASELKALLEDPQVLREVDPTALNEYLRLEYVPSPRSIIAGVFKLPPGHTLTWHPQRRDLQVRRYWDVNLERSERDLKKRSLDEHAAELLAVLKEAVRMELVSDVPLGVFLSGGIDSSAVAAMMAQLSPGNVNSFSIGFTDRSFDESRHARTVAAHLGLNHRELILEPRMMSDLVPTVMGLLDEPLGDASIIPTYLLYGYLCTKMPPNRLLWWSTLIAVPQMIPEPFICQCQLGFDAENPGLPLSPSTGGKSNAGMSLPMSAEGRIDTSPE